MIYRIKYKLKKLRLKFFLLIKNDFETKELLKLPPNKRKIKYIKKIICSPKKTISVLTGKTLNVKYVEVVLTTVCTLNCKGCSALMSYYKKPFPISLNNNIDSLKRFLDSIDSVRTLRLLGGEPLCYPKLYEVLEFLSKQDKAKKVSIVTNGTLLITNKKVLEILQNKKFDVYISNYGKISKKKDELIKQLQDNNIRYVLEDAANEWRDYGDLTCRNRDKNSLKKQFLNCDIMCNSIYNGELHYCPRSSHGTKLNLFKKRKEDYIDLLDKNITQKQLKKKLYKFFYSYTPYVEACNYCNYGTNELKIIKAGEQYKNNK